MCSHQPDLASYVTSALLTFYREGAEPQDLWAPALQRWCDIEYVDHGIANTIFLSVFILFLYFSILTALVVCSDPALCTQPFFSLPEIHFRVGRWFLPLKRCISLMLGGQHLQLSSQILPTIRFCKYRFVKTQPRSFIYMFSMTDFMLQQEGWVVLTETVDLTMPKNILLPGPLQKMFVNPRSSGRDQHSHT